MAFRYVDMSEYREKLLNEYTNKDDELNIHRNAYGLVLSTATTGIEHPVVCGHGGSTWLCTECAMKLVD